MDTVDKQLLLKDLSDFGYQLLTPKGSAVDVLLRQVSSDEGRLLEGVPVVLTNVLEGEDEFNLVLVETKLPHQYQKRFRMLAAVTVLLNNLVPDNEKVSESLTNYLEKRDPGTLDNVRKKLLHTKQLNVGNGVVLDAGRLQKTFRNYLSHKFKREQELTAHQVEQRKQAAFLKALNELFTAKQVDLLHKMLSKEPMTKTEKEYYSRTVKPRLKALANERLQSLAVALLDD